MKKVFTLTLALTLIGALTLTLHSCKQGSSGGGSAQTQPAQPPSTDDKGSPINPAFEMDPPIADDVAVQKIEGDEKHVLLLAHFPKGTLKQKTLTINVDEQNVVLRDDGKGDDKVAGDDVFTIKVEEELANIKDAIETQNKNLLSRQPAFHFDNRVMVKDDVANKQLSLDAFNKNASISIARAPFLAAAPPANTKQNSLMITDISVVQDPTRTWNPCAQTGNVNGPWTFGTLMRQLASPDPAHIVNDAQLSAFVLKWLRTWLTPQPVNGETVPARTNINSRIINPWLAKSLAAGAPAGQLDMRFAPFRLLAIVNRLDLRGNSGYGPSSAGEGRFVFCLINLTGCSAQQFNVIFEFGVNKRGCAAVKAYGKQWFNLTTQTLGSPAYRAALQAITDQFSKCGTNTSKPNQSSLNQLRTNEIALTGPWELREFNLIGSPGVLKQVTVKQEPKEKFNGHLPGAALANVTLLANFVNGGGTTVPETFSGQPFLGGVSHTKNPPIGPPPTAHHWNGTVATGPGFITGNDARFNLSLNTCSGCHGGETQTDFTQIHPTGFGAAAGLAGFLTGISVKDAANRPSPPTVRTFADLDRRAIDLQHLVSSPCKGIFGIRDVLVFRPIRMVH